MTVLDLYLKLHPCKTEERDGRPCMVCFHTRHLLAGCVPILPTVEAQTGLMSDPDPAAGYQQFIETKAVCEALCAAALMIGIFSCTMMDPDGETHSHMALGAEGFAHSLSATLRRFGMRSTVKVSIVPTTDTPEVTH